jgi:hypothetical protein
MIRIRKLYKEDLDKYCYEVVIGWRSIPITGFWFTVTGIWFKYFK